MEPGRVKLHHTGGRPVPAVGRLFWPTRRLGCRCRGHAEAHWGPPHCFTTGLAAHRGCHRLCAVALPSSGRLRALSVPPFLHSHQPLLDLPRFAAACTLISSAWAYLLNRRLSGTWELRFVWDDEVAHINKYKTPSLIGVLLDASTSLTLLGFG